MQFGAVYTCPFSSRLEHLKYSVTNVDTNISTMDKSRHPLHEAVWRLKRPRFRGSFIQTAIRVYNAS